MSIIVRQSRALLLAAALAVGVFGCGDDSGACNCNNGTDPGNAQGGGSGTFVDGRDGKTYNKVKIGNQTWMAENLNYNTADGRGSWCYGQGITIDENTGVVTVTDGQENCVKYGRLYDWSTAMAGSSSSTANPSRVRGVCPSGWHLPSSAEWRTLVNYVGSSTAGTKLKSKNGWCDYDFCNNDKGTDDYGFSALPGGSRRILDDDYLSNGDFRFSNVEYEGVWWTATDCDDGRAYYRYMFFDFDGASEHCNSDKSEGFSVRCVAD